MDMDAQKEMWIVSVIVYEIQVQLEKLSPIGTIDALKYNGPPQTETDSL